MLAFETEERYRPLPVTVGSVIKTIKQFETLYENKVFLAYIDARGHSGPVFPNVQLDYAQKTGDLQHSLTFFPIYFTCSFLMNRIQTESKLNPN